MEKQWENWSGSVKFEPKSIAYPATEAEVARLVNDCRNNGNIIRCIGSGHSFTPLIKTPGVLLSLDNMKGLIHSDQEKQYAEVYAGTKIHELGNILFDKGMAQENLGDIDQQSIAGSTATGTHGTGISFGNLSTQIEGLSLVNGHGETIECSKELNPEVFKASQISLGAMGVITRMKLSLSPSYKLEFIAGKEKLSECLKKLDEYNESNRNFEFYWFPHSETVQTKISNTSEKPVLKNNTLQYLTDVVLENYIFKGLSELSRLFPSLAASICKLSAWGVSTSRKVNYSHKVYALPRLVRFQEMEYNIERKHFKDVVGEIKEAFRQHRFQVHFPIECRFVKGDDIYLSPAYQRDSAYIAVHVYKGMAYKKYFEVMESIFRKYDGRPHWGKMHSLKAPILEKIYPAWEKFQAVRMKMDPEGIFLNDYMKELLLKSPVKKIQKSTGLEI